MRFEPVIYRLSELRKANPDTRKDYRELPPEPMADTPAYDENDPEDLLSLMEV